jgi:NADH/NAD ratio-sensing transcriptional regulator Rex
MENELKSDRFKRVAERRTKVVLRDLRILGNCGNKGNYSYTSEQIRKIFSEVEHALKEARGKFHLPKKEDFKL